MGEGDFDESTTTERPETFATAEVQPLHVSRIRDELLVESRPQTRSEQPGQVVKTDDLLLELDRLAEIEVVPAAEGLLADGMPERARQERPSTAARLVLQQASRPDVAQLARGDDSKDLAEDQIEQRAARPRRPGHIDERDDGVSSGSRSRRECRAAGDRHRSAPARGRPRRSRPPPQRPPRGDSPLRQDSLGATALGGRRGLQAGAIPDCEDDDPDPGHPGQRERPPRQYVGRVVPAGVDQRRSRSEQRGTTEKHHPQPNRRRENGEPGDDCHRRPRGSAGKRVARSVRGEPGRDEHVLEEPAESRPTADRNGPEECVAPPAEQEEPEQDDPARG